MQYNPSPADQARIHAIQRLVGEVYQRARLDPAANSLEAARTIVSRLPPELALHCAVEFVADALLDCEDDAIAGAGA
jgi:hypothetical protein